MWLSWIERLTTDQKAGGSNPLMHAIYFKKDICQVSDIFFYSIPFRAELDAVYSDSERSACFMREQRLPLSMPVT